MKISIITVAYNSEGTIKDTIESVINQSYSNVEYIIVDGKSTDKTCEIVASYGDKIARFISESDNGIYDAMNKGISIATGDVIGILNSDDFYSDNDVLKNIFLSFQKDCDAVYADLVYINPSNKNKVARKWISGEYKEGAFLRGWMPPHPTFFVRKSIYQKFGVFTDKLRSAADYEIMLRFIHKEKIKLTYLPKVIVHMRTGGASNSSLKNRIKANKEDRLAWKLNGLTPSPLTFLRKPLSKISQFFKK